MPPAPPPPDDAPSPASASASASASAGPAPAPVRGALHVFLGMAPGVGKTYAMLTAARRQMALGVDVLAARVETHDLPETAALAQGLPRLETGLGAGAGAGLGAELDLDGVLKRAPQLALVDDLAQVNPAGFRHPRRHQDIQELLEAGISVYTTLNVRQVESRAQTVAQITGTGIPDTVPDGILDHAEIELVDLAPAELRRRLDEGKVFVPDRGTVGMVNFFREGNLAALREMTLRLAAEKVGREVREHHHSLAIRQPWKTGHRLLVAVGPSPLSADLVRWTRRLADSLGGPWLAVHIEKAGPLGLSEQRQLTANLALARELGAEVVTSVDADVVRGLLRVARRHNVTQIVVGKPAPGPWRNYLGGGPLPRRLVEDSGDIDIHVVRAGNPDTAPAAGPARPAEDPERREYAAALGVVVVVTIVGQYLSPGVLNYRAVALLYLLAVVALARRVARGPVFFAATVSALLWDFFFLPPVHTLWITTVEDGLMFGMYFVVALVIGQVVAQLRAQERAEHRREERTAALYLLTRELADAATLEAIVAALARHLRRLFQADAAVLLANAEGRLGGACAGGTLGLRPGEMAVAAWAFEHRQRAGQYTSNLRAATALHLPLDTPGGPLGVLSVRLPAGGAPSFEQAALLEACARQAALVLDRHRLQELAQQIRLDAESERLSRTLLDSISHELRTPIAAIAGAAGVLGAEPGPSPGMLATVGEEIREAVARLNRLVGNLLDIARVESGQVRPKMDWCDLADLVHVTVKHLRRELAGRPLAVVIAPELPLVRLDFVLMETVLTNLLLNAVNHTPRGAALRIGAECQEGELLLTVADAGPGIPDDARPRLFHKFYRVPGTATGGTGLGLSIVKGFVEAQNGRVQVDNQPSGGARFTIRLPLAAAPAVPAETL